MKSADWKLACPELIVKLANLTGKTDSSMSGAGKNGAIIKSAIIKGRFVFAPKQAYHRGEFRAHFEEGFPLTGLAKAAAPADAPTEEEKEDHGCNDKAKKEV